MTTYKALKGKKIKFLASDPTGAAGEGQVWYNGVDFKTTSRLLAWGAGGNLNTARGIFSGAGNTTAGLVMGGSNAPKQQTEEYNGTTWSEQNDMGTARYYFGSAGTQTAALAYGGEAEPIVNTEKYDGTSWTEVNNLNTARWGITGTGVQTAVIRK